MRPESYQQAIARWNGNTPAGKLHPLRMVAIFVAVFFALQLSWESCRGTAIERTVIDAGTVAPASGIINFIWPAYAVRAQGHSIVSAAGRLNVLNGCEGLELAFLLAAAFAAHPMPWRQRAIGVVLGAVIVYAANQGRLIALWYAFVHDRSLFGLLHGTVVPLLLIALCLLYFTAFIGRDAVRAS